MAYIVSVLLPSPLPQLLAEDGRCDLLFLKVYNNRENYYTVLNLPVWDDQGRF